MVQPDTTFPPAIVVKHFAVLDLRREPYRLFFPLGLAIAWAGMLPWFLFGRGVTRTWPGPAHALTMTQAFLAALAVGFLGTLLPRRTQRPPLAPVELSVLAAALAAVPIALHVSSLAAAEIAALAVLATLGRYVMVTLPAPTLRRSPPSFVLIPLAVLTGLIGAGLVLAFALGAAPWTLSLGRQLAQQGVILALVLALAPVLGPIFSDGAPTSGGAHLPRRLLHLAAGLALLASFPIEEWLSPRSGLLLRGTVVAADLFGTAWIWRPATLPGLHRRLFRLALWLMPAGLLLAGAAPARRIPFLHITFVGGLSMLALAVSVHVTLLHTGRDAVARRSPFLVACASALLLLAMVVRAAAELVPRLFFPALTLASSLWLLAALAWTAFLAPKLLRE